MKRREFLTLIGVGSLMPLELLAKAGPGKYLTKKIPSTGQTIPIIGMGSSRTFNVGGSKALRDGRTEVLKTFFEMGGQVIDSSPMYGTSEDVIGYALRKIKPKRFVSATKVWTSSVSEGKKQFEESLKLWGVDHIDVYQIHNLVNWKGHLKVLRHYKAEGKIKYIGITTSHQRRTDEFRKIMKNEKLDFAQFSYNFNERWHEKENLKIAQDRGIATMINRPFERGYLFDQVKDKKLPDFAKDIDCENWAQFFLKWVVSHPGVTCAIPATSKVAHMKENMGAQTGRLPDSKMRDEMLKYFKGL